MQAEKELLGLLRSSAEFRLEACESPPQLQEIRKFLTLQVEGAEARWKEQQAYKKAGWLQIFQDAKGHRTADS